MKKLLLRPQRDVSAPCHIKRWLCVLGFTLSYPAAELQPSHPAEGSPEGVGCSTCPGCLDAAAERGYRITEWFGLEGTFKIIWVRTTEWFEEEQSQRGGC